MANHRSLHANRIARFLTLALAAALVIPPIVLSSSATATNLAAEGWMSASAAATGWEAEYRAAIWGQRGGRGGGGGRGDRIRVLFFLFSPFYPSFFR